MLTSAYTKDLCTNCSHESGRADEGYQVSLERALPPLAPPVRPEIPSLDITGVQLPNKPK